MSATRTLIDLARFVPSPALTTALDSALRDGLTSEALLHPRITALRATGRHGIPRLLAVIEGAELLGYRWHRTKEQMSRDASRMNALILDGFVPMQFSYDQVTNEASWVLSQVRAAFGVIAA